MMCASTFFLPAMKSFFPYMAEHAVMAVLLGSLAGEVRRVDTNGGRRWRRRWGGRCW